MEDAKTTQPRLRRSRPQRKAMTFKEVALASAKSVAWTALIVVLALAFIAVGWDHRATIAGAITIAWNTTLWAASVGGQFWGAVAVGCAALLGLGWSVSVWLQISSTDSKEVLMRWSCFITLGIWITAQRALARTYTAMDDLTTVEVLAVLLVSAPLLLCFVAALIVAMNQLLAVQQSPREGQS